MIRFLQALCGFSNFGALAIQMAALSSLVPTKSKIIASIATKSMIAGNIGKIVFEKILTPKIPQ